MNEIDQLEGKFGRSATESVAAATLKEHVNVTMVSALKHSVSKSEDFRGIIGQRRKDFFSTAVSSQAYTRLADLLHINSFLNTTRADVSSDQRSQMPAL